MTLVHTNKTKLQLDTPDDFIPYLEKYFESFKRLTPELINRIQTEILNHESIKGNIFDLLKKTLRLGSGSLKPDKMKSLLGWSDEELKEHSKYMASRCISKLIKSGLSIEDTKIEYAKQQAKSSKRSIEYYLANGYSEEDALKSVKEYQSSMVEKQKESMTEKEFDEYKKKTSKRCLEYYLVNGYSEEDAKEEITKLQSKCSKRSVDYWINKGYSEEDAIKAVSEYQVEWVLNKTPEELEAINKSKANAFGFNHFWNRELDDIPGRFYIIKLNENLHKIGITSRNINERYIKEDLNNVEIKYDYACSSIQEAFEIEQLIKRDFKDKIHKDDYGPFGWTEVIHDTFENVQIKFDEYINNKELVSQKFNAIRKNT